MTFDFIIVGAGSAGCVLAERLSRSGANSVLLIEGGGADLSPLVHMPRGFGRILSDKRYTRVYAPKKTGGGNDQEYWVRGKTLGGSSSVNGMLYVRGLASDYDDWRMPGWGWKEMSAAFRDIEDHELGAGAERGAGGPLKVTIHPERPRLCESVIEAAGEVGVPRKQDINEGDAEGIGYYPRTIAGGIRQSAARAFLRPALTRSNLHLVTHAEAERVVFEGSKAVGVQVRAGGAERLYLAGKEIILAAGALETPKLLQLSGVGPEALLRRHGIEVVIDAPDVGRNLREHRLMLQQFRVSGGSQNAALRGLPLWWNTWLYIITRNGPMSHGAFEVGGYIKSRPGLDRPNAQILMGLVARDLNKLPAFVPDGQPGVSCGGYVMRPQSRGSIEIQSADPKTPALIDPNYLSHESDRQIGIEIVRWVRRLFETAPLEAFDPTETFPGAHVASDDEIVDALHRDGRAGYHAACTCRMGEDADSVVDPQLRVRGVSGLRVADISVMPSLVSGNTNAPAMAIGWRAADLVLG